jgi:tetratricopeptide (TPR) repeat protein
MKIRRQRIGRERIVAPLVVLILGVIAYSNSLTGPFIFDDNAAIVQNPEIRTMVPFRVAPLQRTTIRGRPITIFTFAADFRLAGLRVGVYHLTNLAIHLMSGLFIYAIVRRTLLQIAAGGPGFLRSAPWLAAAVASIWVVHPLTTQSVTYIVQRSESLAGMFFLASLYCLIRSASGSAWWQMGAAVTGALGMGSKEMVAVLPLVALVYDRTFLAGGFVRALRLRWKMYVGLLAGWGFIIYSLHAQEWGKMAGTNLGISAIDYGRTQLDVIAHYVALAFWPLNLSLDYYDWPIARSWSDISSHGWLVLAAALASLVAVKYNPWIGFLGVWFFAILAPTSSFLPFLDEAAAEQRMYLPLVALVALVVIGGWVLLQQWKVARSVSIVAGLSAAIVLTTLTVMRNAQYASAIDIWTDTIAKRPNNPRAHANLGSAWAQASIEFPPGSHDARAAAEQAAQQFRLAMNLEPKSIGSVFALGESLVRMGDIPGAEQLYTEQLPHHPEAAADLYVERGTLRAQQSDWPQARTDFEAAITKSPNDIEAHYYLALLDQRTGDFDAAKREFANVVAVAPDFKDAARRLLELKASNILSSTRAATAPPRD